MARSMFIYKLVSYRIAQSLNITDTYGTGVTIKDNVRESFLESIALHLKECRLRILDDLTAPRLIYINEIELRELFEIQGSTISRKKPNEGSTIEMGSSLSISDRDRLDLQADKLFEQLKFQVIQNILLKYHEFFLLPCAYSNALRSEVLVKLHLTPDTVIYSLFDITGRIRQLEQQLELAVHKLTRHNILEQQWIKGIKFLTTLDL